MKKVHSRYSIYESYFGIVKKIKTWDNLQKIIQKIILRTCTLLDKIVYQLID